LSDNHSRQKLEASRSEDPSSVTHGVVRALADAISRGELAPGQRLVEAELKVRFDAGRSSVREALRHLQAQGLVTLEANRGASVRKLSREEVQDLFSIRERLEGLAAASAARRVAGATAPAGALNKLEKLTARMGRVAERGDAVLYGRLNREWHGALLALACNAELLRLVSQLSLPIFQQQFRGFLDPQSQRQSQAQHEVILQAIVAGDPAAADRSMARHVRSGLAMVQRWGDETFAS
jgi:DNA-binding GntR family transcriptional regulator